MPNKMLIDASHQEETRVVVVRGNRIEEFDFESQDKKQLKGNIYLARVTRVEPSLQAAFIEYGGNRHGFLAFNEIHPDYYQIPVADRQELIRAEAEAAEAEGEDEDEQPQEKRGRRRRRGRGRGRADTPLEAEAEAAEQEGSPANADEAEGAQQTIDTAAEDENSEAADGDESGNAPDDEKASPAVIAEQVAADVISEPVEQDNESDESNGSAAAGGDVESVGADDALDEVRSRRKPLRRNYKIQEVIKRRQILLVQVVKEERGNKGAALTTYLSLAGRYSVLMPNTARGGGISRKITNVQDRKRLKDMVKELEVPTGMGVILRTAGESRTKAEIKRDYEYLLRLWENVRTLTLESSAPALVYEEGSLIKRSVRDLYNKDIDEILVAGDDGYREAKDFMRMLMPSHAKSVQPYKDAVPLFARYGVEAQLDRMLQPQVTLKSGGYIIINQTEALVAIDVNSGRSTKEHSIEDTALQTNLEAAEEVARQLRLRDLAGLIVIDFIDMEENRNNRSVEKRLKECLKNDRARIQVGRISHFGLLEMSRQRIRASVLESTTQPCPQCGGTGHIRSESSVALLVIRAIEEALLKDNRHHITVKTPFNTALYILNHKRQNLADLEAQFGLTITVEADDSVSAQHYAIVKGALSERPASVPELAAIEPPALSADEDDEDGGERQYQSSGDTDDGDGDGQRKRRRRRRRRGGRGRGSDQNQNGDGQQDGSAQQSQGGDETADARPADADADADAGSDDDADQPQRKRRRGKRGGRRSREGGEAQLAEAEAEAVHDAVADEIPAETPPAEESTPEAHAAEESPSEAQPQAAEVDAEAEAEAEEKPKPKRRRKAAAKKDSGDADAKAEATEAADTAEEKPEKPKKARKPRAPRGKAAAATTEPVISVVSEGTEETAEKADAPEAANQDDQPRRSGWWQRKGFF
ncbi:ribonuclease E/G [Mesorhizobium sp. Z1-4]|uniref:Rne/Rng family ribonuclease n=1 Tax=Mesorhizobium sp. Z1-4 TaxID=2448478 RepID=UPI000FDBEB7A|nr:ribonuclease E/G [Mesorhizobium sp. Z1-4]